MSQKGQLASLMKRRWISPLDAIRSTNCYRLAARVHELRQEEINVVSRWGGNVFGKKWKEYRIQ